MKKERIFSIVSSFVLTAGMIFNSSAINIYAAGNAEEDETELIMTQTESITYLPGDINKDNTVNAMDYLLLKNKIIENQTDEVSDSDTADLSQDGIINIMDLCLLKLTLLKENDIPYFSVDEFIDAVIAQSNDAFISAGEFLLEQFDKGKISAGENIDPDKFKELCSDNNEIYLKTECPFGYNENLKSSDYFNIEYLKQFYKEGDPVYQLLNDKNRMDSMDVEEIAEQLDAINADFDDNYAISCKGMINIIAESMDQGFLWAKVYDKDCILINNNFNDEETTLGIAVVRGDKKNMPVPYELDLKISDDPVCVGERIEGYDNAFYVIF